MSYIAKERVKAIALIIVLILFVGGGCVAAVAMQAHENIKRCEAAWWEYVRSNDSVQPAILSEKWCFDHLTDMQEDD